MSSIVNFLGRSLNALLFLSSGLHKIASYEHDNNGGAMATLIGDKLETLFMTIHDQTGVSISLAKEHNKYIVLGLAALELLGAILLLLNRKSGAFLLLIFLTFVSVTMHDFWNSKDELFKSEGAQFFKNLALMGGLLIYLSKPCKVKVAKME